TAQINGVAVAGIATKLSVVIPVAVGLIFLAEAITVSKLVGLGVGLIAVMLTAGAINGVNDWRWPIISFIGIGCIDTSFKLFQLWTVTEQAIPAFTTVIFAFAFIAGTSHQLAIRHTNIRIPSISLGLLLGLLNFATVYFLLRVLALPHWESSIVFPLNNFGVIALSTLFGLALFKEKLSTKGCVGLSLALLAIVLLQVDV
ncbi:MAG: EamA/RhaT family transporter, partial [Pseudomonadota bacterium]